MQKFVLFVIIAVAIYAAYQAKCFDSVTSYFNDLAKKERQSQVVRDENGDVIMQTENVGIMEKLNRWKHINE